MPFLHNRIFGTAPAVSNRLKNINWYLSWGVYNHLLDRYKKILNVGDTKFLGQFKDAFAVDGSVLALNKRMESVFQSIHKGHASLKLNTKFSVKVAAVTKLQVTSGKQHDSRFSFVTKAANCLYLIDLGYWSFRLMKKLIDAGSFFVMRLKSNCDPLIVKVAASDLQHLVGKRLSEIDDFLALRRAAGQIDLTVQLGYFKEIITHKESGVEDESGQRASPSQGDVRNAAQGKSSITGCFIF